MLLHLCSCFAIMYKIAIIIGKYYLVGGVRSE